MRKLLPRVPRVALLPVHPLLALLPVAAALLSGCGSDYPVRRVEQPVNVTHELAYGSYRRVFNTAYHILNRYGVVQTSSYSQGEITALVAEDNSLFQKTRRTIQARIVDAGDYYEVECRVLIAVEDSEVVTLSEFVPRYSWRIVGSDPRLEVRLNGEIRRALTGGAFEAKQPLTPEPLAPEPREGGKARPAGPRKPGGAAPKGKEGGKKGATSGATEEVSDGEPEVASTPLTPEAFERLAVMRLQRGAYQGAVVALEAALRHPGEARSAHFLLAQAHFSEGRFLEANAALQLGARRNPAWARSDLDVRSLYAAGHRDFSAQLERLGRAAAEDKDLALLLGYMRLFSEDARGALEAFDRYLAGRPEQDPARAYRSAARARLDAAHGVERF